MSASSAPPPVWTAPPAPTDWGYPPPSLQWDSHTTTAIVNTYLAGLNAAVGKPVDVRVIATLIAYTNSDQKASLIDALFPGHLDRASYIDAGTLGSVLPLVIASSVLLLSSNIQRIPHAATEWHVAGLARRGRHWFVYSSTYDPRLAGPASPPPRIPNQPGLSLPSHLLAQARLPITRKYAPIKDAAGHSPSGRGMIVDAVWLTGSGNQQPQCLLEAAQFLYRVIGDQAGVGPQGPTGAGPYRWVRATL